MKSIFSIFVILLIYQVNAQDLNYRWHRVNQRPASGYVNSVKALDDGIINVVKHSGLMDADPSNVHKFESSGNTVIMYNNQKELVWTATFSYGGFDTKLSVDTANNAVYCYGIYNVAFDADPSTGVDMLTPVGQYSSYIIKLDLDGNYQWSRNIVPITSVNSSVELNEIRIDHGNLYLYGGFKNIVDFDFGASINTLESDTASTGLYITSSFLVKWNPNGDYVDGFSIYGSQFMNIGSLEIDEQNIFFTLLDNDVIDADYSPIHDTIVGAPPHKHLFVLKYDTNFVYKDVAMFKLNEIPLLSVGFGGTVLLSGVTKFDFDADPSTNISNLAFTNIDQQYMIAMDTMLDYQWSFIVPRVLSGSFIMRDLVISDDGIIFSMGEFTGTYDFDPGSGLFNLFNSSSSKEIFIAQYAIDGTFQTALLLENTSSSYAAAAYDLDVKGLNTVLIGTTFKGILDVDPSGVTNTITTTATVPLLIEYKRCNPDFVEISETICDGETRVFGGENFTISGNYIHSFVNQNGCDSIVELNLIVRQLNTEIYSPSFGKIAAVDTSLLSYQWLSCSNNFPVVGVDSTVFSPIDDELYKLVFSDGTCTDTSNCFRVTQGSNYGTPVLDWADKIDGMTPGNNNTITTDSRGNVYVCGSFYETVDMELFNGISEVYQSPNSEDLIIAKYNNDGMLQWVFPAGIQGNTANRERAVSLALDMDENLIVAGTFVSTFDIDPNEYNIANQVHAGSCCSFQAFLIKISPNGELIWNKTIGSAGSSILVEDLAVDNLGNIAIAGSNSGAVADFDPGVGVHSVYGKGFVAKYTKDGNYINMLDINQYSSSGSEVGAVTFDNNNNMIIAGGFNSNTDFDLGSGVNTLTAPFNETYTFLASYDENFNLRWVKKFNNGSSGLYRQSSLITDDFGNIYYAGVSTGKIDFTGAGANSGVWVSTFYGGFLVKYNSNGTVLKKFPYYVNGSYIHTSLDVDVNNNIFLSGKSYSGAPVTVGGGTLPMANGGSFIIKYTNNAVKQWAFEIADENASAGYIGVKTDDFGNFFLIGHGFNAAPFDVDPTSSVFTINTLNTYIAKYGQSCSPINTAISLAGANASVIGGGYYYLKKCSNGELVESGFSNSFQPCETDDYYVVIQMGDCLDSTSCFNYVSNSSVTINTTSAVICQSDSVQLVLNVTGVCNPTYQWLVNGIVQNGEDSLIYYHIGVNTIDTVQGLAIYNNEADTLYAQEAIIINNSSTSSINEVSCTNYVTPSGIIYYNSGIYYDTIPSSLGCDSIIEINLTINNTTSTIIETSCGNFIAPSGIIYNSSGIYNDTIPNGLGCDSIIEINLTINNSSTNSIFETSCTNFISPSGIVYNSSGIYYDTIPNSLGCDSIIEMNLTINHATTSTITEMSCGPYTAPSGSIFNSSGIFNDTIPNAEMCDSIITINLTVTNIDTGVAHSTGSLTITSTSATGIYQWLDCNDNFSEIVGETGQSYTSLVNGSYAVVVTDNMCTDTSVCTIINTVGLAIIDDNSGFVVYPNPSTGTYFVELDKFADIINVSIYDLLGRKIKEDIILNNDNFEVEISGEPGVYHLYIEIDGSEIQFIPLIKE